MVYINDVVTGLIVFPFIAALFTLPYAMVQYHRYGSVSKYRTLIVYSFILYMLIAYFMVILPLPDRASTVGNTLQDHLNLIPFRQIWLYWHDKPIIIARWLAGGQNESVNGYVILILLFVSRLYFVIYFIKEAVLKGERPMAHDKLSGTAYMAVEIPQKSPAE